MKGAAILGIGSTILLVGVVLVIVSIVTLSNDGDLPCTFNNSYCESSYFFPNPEDTTFCCDYLGFCYAKFYCNGDEFVVNTFRYIAIALGFLAIITMIVGCRKMTQEKKMAQNFAHAPLMNQQ